MFARCFKSVDPMDDDESMDSSRLVIDCGSPPMNLDLSISPIASDVNNVLNNNNDVAPTSSLQCHVAYEAGVSAARQFAGSVCPTSTHQRQAPPRFNSSMQPVMTSTPDKAKQAPVTTQTAVSVTMPCWGFLKLIRDFVLQIAKCRR